LAASLEFGEQLGVVEVGEHGVEEASIDGEGCLLITQRRDGRVLADICGQAPLLDAVEQIALCEVRSMSVDKGLRVRPEERQGSSEDAVESGA
jgi:hypothetical protein